MIVTQAITRLQKLEDAIANLPEADLTAFAQWFEEFLADRWDRQIEENILAGRLDKLGQRADGDFDVMHAARWAAAKRLIGRHLSGAI